MITITGIFLGFILGALTLVIVERALRTQRRLIYGVMLIIIPLIYVWFATRDLANPPLGLPIVATLFFGAFGIVGWLWWYPLLGLGLLLHAGWDILHGGPLYHAGVPEWYPAACAAYDVAVGLYLLRPRSIRNSRRGTRDEAD